MVFWEDRHPFSLHSHSNIGYEIPSPVSLWPSDVSRPSPSFKFGLMQPSPTQHCPSSSPIGARRCHTATHNDRSQRRVVALLRSSRSTVLLPVPNICSCSFRRRWDRPTGIHTVDVKRRWGHKWQDIRQHSLWVAAGHAMQTGCHPPTTPAQRHTLEYPECASPRSSE